MAYATDEGLARILARVQGPNRATLERYVSERRANGIRLSTLLNDANHLRAFADFLSERAFESATRADIAAFANQRVSRRTWRSRDTVSARDVRLSEKTLATRKVILKAFMKWLKGGEDYPVEVAWLKTTPPRDWQMPVEQVLTDSDLRRLIEAEHHPQAKAIIATLFDSGTRASEFISLRLCDVSFDEYGAVLVLPRAASQLKTGSRRIRVLFCTPYLREWASSHPAKHRRDAPLWVSLDARSPGVALTASGLSRFIGRAGGRAGLEKKIWPHLFRHSKATACARDGWSETEMRHFFGWSKASDMPSRYVHLSGKDYEESMLRRYGKISGPGPQPILAPRRCACGRENAPTAEYCTLATCGRPLTAAAINSQEESRTRRLLAALEDDDEALRRLAERLMREVLRKDE